MAERKYFGTDGIRGEFGGPVMNEAFAARLGVALARYLQNVAQGTPRVLIGRDTRASGEKLTRALAAGLASENVAVMDAGVLPTPAIALATIEAGVHMGIAITASHNPASDNGIKLFSHEGLKLPDATELEIEERLSAVSEAPDLSAPTPTEAYAAESLYVDRAVSRLPENALAGLTIALDTANGATYRSSMAAFKRLGAEVIQTGDAPNGDNINDHCGSEHTQVIADMVKQTSADIGIAHDGDGDRLVVCDETGEVVDGDQVLGIIALYLLKEGYLKQNTLVATIMSNVGLTKAMEDAGGHLVRTAVGDRYVLEEMLHSGYNFGGEASGHIIYREHGTTGDGLMAALLVLDVLRKSDAKLSVLKQRIPLFPQLKRNLRVKEKIPLSELPALQQEIQEIEAEIPGRGRILVRYSGTEPKIRLLAEGEQEKPVAQALDRLEAAVRNALEVVD